MSQKCKVCGYLGGRCTQEEPEPFQYNPGEKVELIDSMAMTMRQPSVEIIEGFYGFKTHDVGYRVKTEMFGTQVIEKDHITRKLDI